jgi:hypothetical protein
MATHESEALAKSFADAHEAAAGQPAEEKSMDLANNALGRQIARDNPNSDDGKLAELCYQTVMAGKATVLTGPGANVKP